MQDYHLSLAVGSLRLCLFSNLNFVEGCFVCHVLFLVGHILIVGKLKDLVPVLVNCFYGLMSEAYSQPQLDSHYFDCMLSILQSVDLVVGYNVYGIGKYQQELLTSMSSNSRADICLQDEKFPSLLLDRLFAVFPMQPTRSLSEEVFTFLGNHIAFVILI